MNKKIGPYGNRDYNCHVMDEQLWPDIFKRLPIKSLSRFRSVCKRWNDLISSAFFIYLHLSFTSSTPYTLKPYLSVTRLSWMRITRSQYHKRYALFRRFLDEDVKHSRQQLYCPFRAPEDDALNTTTFVDAVHGVVCISYSSVSPPSSNSVFLWNPSIHKYVALPRLSLACHFRGIGLGYDTREKDFKVVLVLESGALSHHVTYQIYSARRGFWRPPVMATTRVRLKHVTNGCFVNGTIHWLVSSRDDDVGRYSLLMFDCELEEITKTDFPEKLFCLPWGGPSTVELFGHAGVLAVLVTWPERRVLWVMKERNSWKKLYMFYVFRQDDRHEWRIAVYDPSFEKLVPNYGFNEQWIKFYVSYHVYDESMLLMDHPNARSYTKEDIVPICTEDSPIPNTSKT